MSLFIVPKTLGYTVTAQAREARLQGHRHVRAPVRRRRRPRGPPARRGRGPRLPPGRGRARARAHQHRRARRGRGRRRARRRRSPTRSSATRWASRSPSTRRSQRSSPTWPAGSRRPASSPTRPPARSTAGERCDMEAGMAKLVASEAALENATEAMRIHGAYGYSTEDHVERYYRDAPLLCIGEGTNEIQRITIARQLVARSNAPPEPVRTRSTTSPPRWSIPFRSPLPSGHCSTPSPRVGSHDGFGAPAHSVSAAPCPRSAASPCSPSSRSPPSCSAAPSATGARRRRPEVARHHRLGGRRARPRRSGVHAFHQQPSTRARSVAFAVLAAARLSPAWAFQRLRFARAGSPAHLRIVGLPPGRAPPALRIV